MGGASPGPSPLILLFTAVHVMAGLVDYREGSSDSASDSEYVIPQKRLKVDRTAKRRGGFQIMHTQCMPYILCLACRGQVEP